MAFLQPEPADDGDEGGAAHLIGAQNGVVGAGDDLLADDGEDGGEHGGGESDAEAEPVPKLDLIDEPDGPDDDGADDEFQRTPAAGAIDPGLDEGAPDHGGGHGGEADGGGGKPGGDEEEDPVGSKQAAKQEHSSCLGVGELEADLLPTGDHPEAERGKHGAPDEHLDSGHVDELAKDGREAPGHDDEVELQVVAHELGNH